MGDRSGCRVVSAGESYWGFPTSKQCSSKKSLVLAGGWVSAEMEAGELLPSLTSYFPHSCEFQAGPFLGEGEQSQSQRKAT